MLRAHARHVPRDRVAHGLVDGLHFFLGLRRGEAVEEEIDIGRRERVVVVVLAHGALRRLCGLGQGREASLDGSSGRDDVIPVGELREGALGEDGPVLLELIETRNHRWLSFLAATFRRERMDVAGIEI